MYKNDDSFSLYDKLEYDKQIINESSERIELDQFISKLDTGDIVFSRSETTFGKIIQFSDKCVWNHIAMIIVDDDGVRYWCESTNSTRDGQIPGVKIWNIKEKFQKQFEEKPGIKFTLGLSKLCNSNIVASEDIRNYLLSQRGKPYTQSKWTLFYSWCDGFSTIRDRFCCGTKTAYSMELAEINQPEWALNVDNRGRSFFCSELIASCLLSTGMMKRRFNVNNFELPASEWTVSNFVNTEYLNNNLTNNFKYTQINFYLLISTN